MFGTTFYHGTAKKLIIAFGSVFNNIHVQRKADDGSIITDIRVPLSYESKKKYMAKLIADPVKNRGVPRMGFIMNDMQIDTTRQTNMMNEMRFSNSDPNKRTKLFSPVPYNYRFQLDIYVDYMDDGLQIIEQILPYFQPDFNIVIEEIPDMDLKRDIPIQLEGVTLQDEFEGEFSEQRIVNWTLDFTMKAWLYPPVREGGVIKDIVTNYMVGSFDPDAVPYEQVRQTVDPFTAAVDDNWTVKMEVGHPDDDQTKDTMTEVNWPQ